MVFLAMGELLEVVTLSTLYPNEQEPTHGIFVENRLRKINELGEVNFAVLAPVPWFPVKADWAGVRSRFARIPRAEKRFGVCSSHPRYLLLPKFGMTLAPVFIALASIVHIRKMMKHGKKVKLIDAHYYYPDGVAAAIVSKVLGIPVLITARGTDINLIPRYRLPRWQILWAAKHAAGSVTVCEALRQNMIDIGADGSKITTLRNGVDLAFFTAPENRAEVRKELCMQTTTLISVGHLIDRKGHDLVIRALSGVEGAQLRIIGAGEKLDFLQSVVRENQLEDRVFFEGTLSQAQLVKFYGAADLLVLASSREGWANVLLESMACGTAVVATRVGGAEEVISEPAAGLVTDRNVEALRSAILQALDNPPARDDTRRYAEKYAWEPTAINALNLFKKFALT